MQMIYGLIVGAAIGASAIFQGMIGAWACDALGENDGKGLSNYIMLIGIAESVALLVMILAMLKIPQNIVP